jgi:cytochrome bd ubiquinol oxidase subunit II
MTLATVWFCLIGILWAGYFLLEGFDFGVGMLLPWVGRDEEDRNRMLGTIGPVWDGNEVWLVVATGATFAAFPAWYATMFSALYLALLLILVCLIVRVVSFEWRERSASPRTRLAWQWANTVGSVGAPFLWGVALANLLHGLPLDEKGVFTGTFLDLFDGYTVLAGFATVLLFALHGATFLTLRIHGDLGARAAAAARRRSAPTAVVVVAFLAWTVVVAVDGNERGVAGPLVPAVLGAIAVVLCAVLVRTGRVGWAFAATGVAAVAIVATLFTGLYPRVLVSDPSFANSLTVTGAATEHYALTVITVVGAVLLPVVLLYQGWTYHVLRARLAGGG